jgi:protein ImuB
MPLAEAKALLAGCDVPAHIEPHDPVADVAGLRELARTCNTFSPLFGIEEGESPECVLLDVTGCEHLFGGEHQLLDALTTDFRQRGFQVRAAIAPTLGAAWAIAHHGLPTTNLTASGLAPLESTQRSHHAPRDEPNASNSPILTSVRLVTRSDDGYVFSAFSSCVDTNGLAPEVPALCTQRTSPGITERQNAGTPETSSGAMKTRSLKSTGDESLEETLAPLPVAALRLPRKIVETLHELGLHRIGQLRALPRESLPSRFGSELLRRLDQAFGDTPELLIPERPAEPVAVTWVTDEPLTDRESLRCVCGNLIDELIGRLKPRREGVRQLFCQVKGTAARPVELLVRLISPSEATKHLLELLGLQIDRADLPEGISFVRLEATHIESLATRQRDLFGWEADTDTHRDVSSLLDRLSNRLGATAVVHAALVPDAQPEMSVDYEPCVAAGTVAELIRVRTAVGRTQALASSATNARPFGPYRSQLSACARPLRLFAPPQRIEATNAGPEGAPMHFHWDRREHRVIRSWGPERIETGWWREQSICRDYFRVETHTGQHYWLFHCFNQAAWFIHGAFD